MCTIKTEFHVKTILILEIKLKFRRKLGSITLGADELVSNSLI